MRIGLDLRFYGLSNGGIGRYCRELFPRILQLDEENEYYIFSGKNYIPDIQKAIPVGSNVKIVESKARHYSFSEQIGFLRLLNKYNLDLVHFPNFNVPIFYKRPFITTIHDVVHHKISGAKKSRFLHFLAYKKVIQYAASASKAVITVSEASKKDIVKLLQVNEDKVKVIYEAGCLSGEADEARVEEVKKRYLIKNPYFLFVGVLERKKNIVNLTRGFDYFLQKYKIPMDLVMVGRVDNHYPEIKHKAMDIGHTNNLVFTGHVEDSELEALYSGAHAFVSASLHEGFGLPGVEAMKFALPLLVSNVEVFNEIYDNAGMYFNPLEPADIGEKMNLMVRDSEYYKQLSKNSLERSEIFSWDKTAKETLELYQQILQ